MTTSMVAFILSYLGAGILLCVSDAIYYPHRYGSLAWIIGITAWPYVMYRAYRRVKNERQNR